MGVFNTNKNVLLPTIIYCKVSIDMFNKIRKAVSKKILFYPFVLLFVMTVTLAFIPNYSCACGDKVKRSVLSLIVKAIAQDIRSIFK